MSGPVGEETAEMVEEEADAEGRETIVPEMNMVPAAIKTASIRSVFTLFPFRIIVTCRL